MSICNRFTLTVAFLLCVMLVHAQDFKKILEVSGTKAAYPRLSNDHSRMLFQFDKGGKWQLFVMDFKDSSMIPILPDTNNNYFADWNNDHSLIAFTSDRDSGENIYLYHMKQDSLKRITFNNGNNIHPYFSPDSRYILFSSTAGNGSLDIYRYDIMNSTFLRLTQTEEDETCARYNPGMDKIVYLKNGAVSDDIFILDCQTFLSENMTQTPTVRDGWPMFSNDGKWLYYSSMETGNFSVYRMLLKDKHKQQLTFAQAGEEDARVFISANNRMIVYNKRRNNTLLIVAAEVIR